MDLTIDVENYKLNIRAAVVIIHNNKLLTHRNINSNHYALPGGRVEIGENSEETIKNIEGKDNLKYEWIDIDKINEYPIMPKVIKEIIKEKIYPVHKINDELK